MPKFINRTGQRYGRLVVLKLAEPEYAGLTDKSRRKFTSWICRCDCGRIVRVRGGNLKSGNTQSCGCLHRDVVRANMLTMWTAIKLMEEEENGSY